LDSGLCPKAIGTAFGSLALLAFENGNCFLRAVLAAAQNSYVIARRAESWRGLSAQSCHFDCTLNLQSAVAVLSVAADFQAPKRLSAGL